MLETFEAMGTVESLRESVERDAATVKTCDQRTLVAMEPA